MVIFGENPFSTTRSRSVLSPIHSSLESNLDCNGRFQLASCLEVDNCRLSRARGHPLDSTWFGNGRHSGSTVDVFSCNP